MGRLDDFQRNKVRVWATYGFDLGRFGTARRGAALPLQLGEDLQPTPRRVPLIARSRSPRNPGYARPPTSQTIFFGERGSQSFAGYHLVDLAATYGVPVWQSLRPWVKVEVLNALNNQKLIALGHVGHRRHGRAEGRERAAAQLHQVRRVRHGQRSGKLPSSSRGHGRRPYVPRVARHSVLVSD